MWDKGENSTTPNDRQHRQTTLRLHALEANCEKIKDITFVDKCVIKKLTKKPTVLILNVMHRSK
jgi:hypothetical protein